MSDQPVDEDGTGEQAIDSVDLDALRSVCLENPVRLAVLFGSRVTGTADGRSDLDLLVEFDESVEETVDAYRALLGDVSVALDRNDVDLSLVGDVDPRVGYDALDAGVVVVGTDERVATLKERFEEERPDQPSPEDLRERFDEALANVDRALDGEA